MTQPTPPTPAPPAPPAAPGSACFPKALRVRDRKEFQRIQGRGTRLSSAHFLIMALRQPGKPGPARLGITASRKSGESVQRSRVKRLIRECFRMHKEDFARGWDFVVIARAGGAELSLEAVLTELRQALSKLKDGAGAPRPPQPPRPGGGKRPGKPPPRPKVENKRG